MHVFKISFDDKNKMIFTSHYHIHTSTSLQLDLLTSYIITNQLVPKLSEIFASTNFILGLKNKYLLMYIETFEKMFYCYISNSFIFCGKIDIGISTKGT